MNHLPLPSRLLVSIVLLGLLFLTLSGPGIPLPAEPEPLSRPHQQTLTPRAYLPLVMRNYCGDQKCWSGEHLGNRTDEGGKVIDWNTTFLQRIDPMLGGKWPAAVVVLSNQVYWLNRYPSTDPIYPCRIYSAAVRDDTPVVFDYVKRAAQAGVRVVIRIYPSPGNFEDWNDPNWSNHHLSSGLPVGPEGYCRPDLYRSKADIADEMGAIHEVNGAYGFSEFGFEPANEPNTEWYSDEKGNVRRLNVVAWQEMDDYFSAQSGNLAAIIITASARSLPHGC